MAGGCALVLFFSRLPLTEASKSDTLPETTSGHDLRTYIRARIASLTHKTKMRKLGPSTNISQMQEGTPGTHSVRTPNAVSVLT